MSMANTMRTMEILVGAFMAPGFVALFFLAMKVSNLSAASSGDGYMLIARFDNIGSLKVRAPVSMAGVRSAGWSHSLRSGHLSGLVTLRIDAALRPHPRRHLREHLHRRAARRAVHRPGSRRQPGLPGDGDQIEHTQSALVLEQMIGQFLFSKAEEGSE
jgi:phospholipid/cholesterol/gamma-HCH transport system substrate-binding protein